MTYLEELRDVIRRLHGADAQHVESVPVKETFQGKTVWEGVVEVFVSAWARHSQQGLRVGARHGRSSEATPARHGAARAPGHIRARRGESGHRPGVWDS